ncbi:hypothetical protein [Nocardia sp. NPDC051981]
MSNDHRWEMLFQLHRENLRAVVVLDGALVTLAELLPMRWQELWDD